MRIRPAIVASALYFLVMGFAFAAEPGGFGALHPRPSGYFEPTAPPIKQHLTFSAITETSGVSYDVTANFPKGAAPAFHVEKVSVNGKAADAFVVFNQGIFNGHAVVDGGEDFGIAALANWEPNKPYEITIDGADETGKAIHLAATETSPSDRGKPSVSFAGSTAEFPYHQIILTIPREAIQAGTVTSVEVDGKKSRDAHYFNFGKAKAYKTEVPNEGETYDGIADGARDFRVTAPLNWINSSQHSMKVVITDKDKKETVYEASGTAQASGGYWSADWPHSASLVVEETAGITRQQEPVQVTVGLFADDITKPENEIRVITYDPTHPKAGPDGWVVAPSQVMNVSVWRDERLLNSEERDPETKQLVHRYDATTSVELVFSADVAAYESRVFYIVYGNPKAEKPKVETDLKITKGEGLSQTIDTGAYSYYLSKNSGAVETITVRGEGDPILLEHKLETNGAVHWNPDFYSPPTPWVHASDWETPIYDQISGPLLHRTRCFAPLPHMDSVNASVSYSFFAGKPYVIMTSYMEVQKDLFVQALRNGEVVFNKVVLNEFVWQDPLGKVDSLAIANARKHPIHAIEVPADTPWLAFVNRDKQVGFANIALESSAGNRFGQPPSLAQPYFYVENGPWVYFARPLVYPFGGTNFTRMMPVRGGSYYAEKNAWVAFRFAKGSDPFAEIKHLQKELTNPLRVREWMATDARTPETWVMPILTMPFNEGVVGAVSGQKKVDEPKEGNKK